MTIASLPMYWRAENADLWRAFWSVLQDCAQAEGIKLPDLTPPEDLPTDWYTHWLSPDLALSMTCGLPFRTALAGKVQYIGTLDFGLGGPPGHYHSQILTRADLSSPPQKLAFNSADSQSGWAATQDIPNRAALTSYVATGGHSASLAAVAETTDPAKLADLVSGHLGIEVEKKQELLETLSVAERLERVYALMQSELSVLQVEMNNDFDIFHKQLVSLSREEKIDLNGYWIRKPITYTVGMNCELVDNNRVLQDWDKYHPAFFLLSYQSVLAQLDVLQLQDGLLNVKSDYQTAKRSLKNLLYQNKISKKEYHDRLQVLCKKYSEQATGILSPFQQKRFRQIVFKYHFHRYGIVSFLQNRLIVKELDLNSNQIMAIKKNGTEVASKTKKEISKLERECWKELYSIYFSEALNETNYKEIIELQSAKSSHPRISLLFLLTSKAKP